MKDWGDCVVNGVAKLTCIPVVLNNVIVFALIASGVVAVFFIIWGGAKYVTSGGDQKKVDNARKTIMWAIIGLILVLLSIAIVQFVGFFTGTQNCVTTNVSFNNPNCK